MNMVPGSVTTEMLTSASVAAAVPAVAAVAGLHHTCSRSQGVLQDPPVGLRHQSACFWECWPLVPLS